MSPRRSLVICRQHCRLLLHDAFPIVLLILMPLVLIAFITPTYAAILRGSGHQDATGAEQAIPGLSVIFAFFALSFIGNSFYREHGWRTWERVRASEARPLEIVVGKLLLPFGLLLSQQAIVFGAGLLVFGLRVHGSWLALCLVSVSFALFLVSLGILLAAVCRSIQQISTMTNLGAMVLGGLGGGLTPVELMPGWTQALAHATPTYWAIQGLRGAVLGQGDLWTVVAMALAYLLGGAVVCLVVASRRFRVEETKAAWLV